MVRGMSLRIDRPPKAIPAIIREPSVLTISALTPIWPLNVRANRHSRLSVSDVRFSTHNRAARLRREPGEQELVLASASPQSRDAAIVAASSGAQSLSG